MTFNVVCGGIAVPVDEIKTAFIKFGAYMSPSIIVVLNDGESVVYGTFHYRDRELAWKHLGALNEFIREFKTHN